MDFSSHNPTTSNSLNLAARNNEVTIVRRLLKKINPNCVDNRGWTCLHEAANRDSYDSLILILKHPDCRPLSRTHEGHTALYLACRNHCSLKTITLLLQTVSTIANYSSTEGVTPLHVASEQGRVELIELLLLYGADIDAKDFDGDTPLHEACLAKQPEAIKVLLRAGANPQIQNEQLFTPFHIACTISDLNSVSNLIYYINDVNETTASGETPLMIAVRSYNDNIMLFLLDNGANPNLKNNTDKLALDIALDIGYSYAFKKLLSVTKNDFINLNIVCRACKPHYFTFDIIEALMTSHLGPSFFNFSESCGPPITGTVEELNPIYLTHAPLNAYLSICEYIYKMSQDKFKEFFNLFLKRDVSVNAREATEFPPLAFIHTHDHTQCFCDVLDILMKHGCNVDYFSDPANNPDINDAFLVSLFFDPSTIPYMIPYSLYCDPDSIMKIAANHGMIDTMPLTVQKSIICMIDDIEMIHGEYVCYVPSLKHLSRLKVRDIIRSKDGVMKTTQQFLEILSDIPVPKIIKHYLQFYNDNKSCENIF